MISKQRRLEIQTQAVRGFSTWLRSSPPTDTEEAREFNDELIHVFEIYAGELQRQIDGSPATPVWLNVIAVTSMLALMLKDEFLEINPELIHYRPQDEPMTIDEMILCLLSDAIDRFETCGRPEELSGIENLVDRIRNAKATA